MYNNLKRALQSKGISYNAAAAVVGMPEPTFRGKMSIADRSFSFEEALKIKLNLFPELDIIYLFQKDTGNVLEPDQKGV